MFVVFAPGMGGNHLANIVSLCRPYRSRFDIDVYNSDATTFHADNNTHLTIEQLEQGPGQVIPCHLAEYLWHRDKIEQLLPNRKFIVLEFQPFSRNTVWQLRSAKFNPAYNNIFQLEELATFYSVDTFSKLTNETDFFPASVDQLFTPDASALYHSLLQHIDADINFDYVQQLHSTWYNVIKN
jgi:hypothetical protein